jgi:hypothetical protein
MSLFPRPEESPLQENRPPKKTGPKRRYFGITVNQWAVLAVLGLLILVILGFAGWTVFQMTLSGDLFPTQVVLPTSTPVPTETLLPTHTPRLPTPTATELSYEALIPQGWVQWNVGKTKFWTPSNLVRTDPGKNLLKVIDLDQTTTPFQTNIILSKDSVPAVDMDTYVSENLKSLPGYSKTIEITFLERKKMDLGPYETVRLKIETILSGLPAEAAVYIFKDGDNFWLLTCTTDYSTYYTWLPKFDQVARTFRTTP